MQTLPRTTVQPDWADVVSDVLGSKIRSEGFWVSTYNKEMESIHGKVEVSLPQPGQVELDGSKGVVVSKISNYAFQLSVANMGISDVLVKRPQEVYKQSGPINAIGSSPGGELFVVGGDSGILRIGDVKTGSIQRHLKGHKGDITRCLFFPSGEVVLSASIDLQIKIWGVKDGSNPMTLKGHVKAVRDLAIVERGRNILSCSGDGSIKLWECATGAVIHSFGDFDTGINSISLGSSHTTTTENNPSTDPREVGTNDKLVVCGVANGLVAGYDLRTRQKTFSTRVTESPIETCYYDPEHGRIATGSSSGVVTLFDIKDMSTPLGAFQRSDASINSINLAHPSGDLLVATGDGSPCRVAFDGTFKVVEEFTGFEIDPVYAVDWNQGLSSAYCGGRDGVLRRYV